MPLYEYECSKCEHRFEKIEKMTAPHRQKCPKCRAMAERMQAAPAIQFKGGGWYVTDYARKTSGGDAAPEKAEKAAGESKEGKDTKEKTEKKEPSKKDHKHK
ncbi:MAG: zinc ribbon domain-containing protein [Acidobacteria bacterium]|nr:zinc ribbon domain-containing protein [Acidobacteriota bacterium]MBI3663737.1 zinc ribbon domain-containing protein [Acidobacteriota bacterium]